MPAGKANTRRIEFIKSADRQGHAAGGRLGQIPRPATLVIALAVSITTARRRSREPAAFVPSSRGSPTPWRSLKRAPS
jgi:hypothetical protein